MPIAKRDIVELLLSRNDIERAIRADDELPELVDTDLHADLLWDLGLDPMQLSHDLAASESRFARSPSTVNRPSLAGRA